MRSAIVIRSVGLSKSISLIRSACFVRALGLIGERRDMAGEDGGGCAGGTREPEAGRPPAFARGPYPRLGGWPLAKLGSPHALSDAEVVDVPHSRRHPRKALPTIGGIAYGSMVRRQGHRRLLSADPGGAGLARARGETEPRRGAAEVQEVAGKGYGRGSGERRDKAALQCALYRGSLLRCRGVGGGRSSRSLQARGGLSGVGKRIL